MNQEQREQIESAIGIIDMIDDSDAGDACRRVAIRKLTEALGLPLNTAPLLKEDPNNLKPLYCPSQYS